MKKQKFWFIVYAEKVPDVFCDDGSSGWYFRTITCPSHDVYLLNIERLDKASSSRPDGFKLIKVFSKFLEL